MCKIVRSAVPTLPHVTGGGAPSSELPPHTEKELKGPTQYWSQKTAQKNGLKFLSKPQNM